MDRQDIALLRAINGLQSELSDKDKSLIDAIAIGKGESIMTVRSTGLEFDDGCLDAIDRGLDFVGKAIGEDRRFIRSTGEVLPVEKIKRVSKETIIHLGRHSDLVKEVDGDEIVPDKLYSAERLNDYATYENRFLCTLLCMIKEFLDDKYDLISKGNVSQYNLGLDRQASSQGRKLAVKLELSYESENSSAPALEKIERLRQKTDFYLRTPLMTEAAKEDKVRYLTKTNVLRMDKNFSEAADLFEFLLSYRNAAESKELFRDVQLGDEENRRLILPIILESFAVRLIESGIGAEECAKAERKLFEEEAAKVKAEIRGEGGAEKYIKLLTDRIGELDAENVRISRSLDQAKKLSEQSPIERLECVERERDELAFSLEEARENEKKVRLELGGKIDELTQKLALTEEKLTLMSARLNALREVAEDELTSPGDLDELEREFFALGNLLSDRWNRIKTELKRQHMGDLIKIIKGTKEAEGDGRKGV